ncbi:MAG: hypothetical protein JJE25_14945, partial [Bacteroidia bacterium]|nr:hypothetical protein [Bacteroidia bacterium]
NNTFCNEEQLEIFCDDFEKAIANFKGEKQSEVIRTKSLYEKSWMYFVLVGMSIIAAAVFFWADKDGKHIPGSMWVVLGSIAAMWAAYYKSKSKGKIKESKLSTVTKNTFSKVWNYCFDKWLLPIVFSIFTFGILFLFAYLPTSETYQYAAASFFFLSLVILLISSIFQFIKQRWLRGILTIVFLISAIILMVLSYNAET